MDWIGLGLEKWTHVQLCLRHALSGKGKGKALTLIAPQAATAAAEALYVTNRAGK